MTEKAFLRGIVPAVSTARHGLAQLFVIQDVNEFMACKMCIRDSWGTSLRLYLLVTTRRVDNEVMRMQKALPIGNDQFRIVREKDYYYIDKTLLIKEFLELRDTASLITRPRRFGKTLNMTMLREFFDITRDSREIFKGLAIMDTKYASLINTKPVICFSFKDCSGKTQDELQVRL